MDREERIERIEDGRNAVISHGFILGPVLEARETIIKRLVAYYRSGQINHDVVVGGIAEIAALDNLIAFMENTINRGNVAEQKEFQNG